MTPERFHEITSRYGKLRLAVVGDFCLDRYLEMDPAREETSIETGLPVHNVVNVRAQPGAAGTILNNLVALGVGELHPVGFCGEDGEGFELRRALSQLHGVHLHHFLTTPLRRTFTYCKPLVLETGKPPRELSRLDSKNWTPTPTAVADRLTRSVQELRLVANAMVVMDQVDLAGTGVVSAALLKLLRTERDSFPPVIADSRRGLKEFPPVIWKMNLSEMAALQSVSSLSIDDAARALAELAVQHQQPVFVSLSEQGILGAGADGMVHQVPALPLRGPIDIVGAGDAVTANLITALAAGASTAEAMQLAMAAASVVVHQLGTTGTATIEELARLLPFPEAVGIRSSTN